MDLLIRERADLRETKEEYQADVAVADAWVQKNLDTKKAKAQSGIAAPPPPPPPEQASGGGEAATPTRIRVSELEQEKRLAAQVFPSRVRCS